MFKQCLHMKNYFLNKQHLLGQTKQKILTENHASPMVSEIYTKQSINEVCT
jgi:hypothetical protein